jgi:serine/threonine protein kinase
MLGKLSGMFGSNRPSGAKPRRSRVNLERRFTFISLTAQGSMARVQRAVDNQTGRTVCLKVQLKEKHAAAAARTSKDAARPEEGDVGLKIVHPHVVRTFECGESTRGEHFISMEFIDGVSLQFVRETNSANLERKLELLTQAASAVEAVHAAGFIHHDINPRNFLVNREGEVKLIDFGLAVPNTPAFRRPGNRTGTLQYMAPELIRREPTDERLDIFSFGAMAFEFITGRLPYEGGGPANSMAIMLQRINHDPLDPTAAEPRLHPALAQILRRSIARRKDERYPSMTDMIRDLEVLPPEAKVLAGPPAQRAGEPGASLVERPVTDGEADETDTAAEPRGGVFMAKAGPHYIIRKSRHFDSRVKLLQKQFADRVELVHTIPADDLDRAEEFWHRRFEQKREKGEWFALTDEDVQEFKSFGEMRFGA